MGVEKRGRLMTHIEGGSNDLSDHSIQEREEPKLTSIFLAPLMVTVEGG